MPERKPTGDQIRVRMYNVGFGDCFLLEFPRENEATPFRVLIDCGVHSAGPARKGYRIGETVAAIIADTGGEDATIDVVVGTHRHRDHVSGFADHAWQNVTVGEVWMPWTEEANDAKATDLRDRQNTLARSMDAALADTSSLSHWDGSSDALSSLQAIVANSLPNADAMSTLHEGFAGEPERRYLSSETPPLEPPDCRGLRVHVLGPSPDPAVVRDMNPPDAQSYLRLLATGQGSGAKGLTATVSSTQRPFAQSFVLSEAEYPDDLRPGGALAAKAKSMTRQSDLTNAIALDRAVNGTSLMLMFQLGSAYLLFPGDAQWGTWNMVMNDQTSRDLIARTTFYKVGHHGSHNATPKKFLEEVLPKVPRMWGTAASTHKVSFWPNIPRQPLLDALSAHSERVVRSDDPGRSRKSVRVRSGVGVDFLVPCGLVEPPAGGTE